MADMNSIKKYLRARLPASKAERALARCACVDNAWSYANHVVYYHEIDLWDRRRRLLRRLQRQQVRRDQHNTLADALAELEVLTHTVTAAMAGKPRSRRWAAWMQAVAVLCIVARTQADAQLASEHGVTANVVHAWRSRGLKALEPFMSEALRGVTTERLVGMHPCTRPAGTTFEVAKRHGFRRRDVIANSEQESDNA